MSSQTMYFDPSKAVRELGFPGPRPPARDALAKAVEWFEGERVRAKGVLA